MFLDSETMASRKNLNLFLFTVTIVLSISLLFIYVTSVPSRTVTVLPWGNWNTSYPWAGDKECGEFVTRIVKPGRNGAFCLLLISLLIVR